MQQNTSRTVVKDQRLIQEQLAVFSVRTKWTACARNLQEELYQRCRDHSMESVRKQFLFTDCDALEKNTKKQQQPKKKKKQRIDWVQRTSEFFLCTQQRMNKSRSSTFHGLLFLFHAYWDFSLLNDIFQRLEALKSKCYYEHQPSTSTTGISKTGTSKTRTCKTRTSKPFLFLHVTSS